MALDAEARTRPLPWLPPSLPRLLRWMLAVPLGLLLLWTAGAIAWLPLPVALPARGVLALVFAALALAALWRARSRWPVAAAVAVSATMLLAWSSVRPSNDRPWRPDVAVMPRVAIDGDRVRISGYRDFVYRSRDDFTERWEERELRLSDIRGVDFFVSRWQPGPIVHTFVSFDVAGAEPVAVSIEVRNQVGQRFDPLRGLYRHFQLAYVAGDERDIVGLRTHHRGEEVLLYHTTASPQAAQRLFRVYADRMTTVAEHPEFYNLFSNNCTVNIVRYANAAGRVGRWDIRHLVNAWSDRYLYAAGMLDTSIPFARLRELSRIDASAIVDDRDPEFSRLIRRGRPVPAVTARSTGGSRTR
ncbi:MAG: DUF4105 domain-containing protein [Pseudoxanthomonas sp.]|nr:DUF4105 domain-containing protein [Pseudoxanthomonas sp.]